jgi:hypothetical protein
VSRSRIRRALRYTRNRGLGTHTGWAARRAATRGLRACEHILAYTNIRAYTNIYYQQGTGNRGPAGPRPRRGGSHALRRDGHGLPPERRVHASARIPQQMHAAVGCAREGGRRRGRDAVGFVRLSAAHRATGAREGTRGDIRGMACCSRSSRSCTPAAAAACQGEPALERERERERERGGGRGRDGRGGEGGREGERDGWMDGWMEGGMLSV